MLDQFSINNLSFRFLAILQLIASQAIDSFNGNMVGFGVVLLSLLFYCILIQSLKNSFKQLAIRQITD